MKGHKFLMKLQREKLIEIVQKRANMIVSFYIILNSCLILYVGDIASIKYMLAY